MALPKLVKVSGSYYKGFELLISSVPGNYVLDMTLNQPGAMNSISITPDNYGAGDYINLVHLDSSGKQLGTIAENIYNLGTGISIMFDFPALEKMVSNDIFRLTYVNVSGVALSIHTVVEYAGVRKS